MTRFIKLTAYYLLFIPAMWLGYFGHSIIPDRKDIDKMSMTKAVTAVVIIASFLVTFVWLALQLV